MRNTQSTVTGWYTSSYNTILIGGSYWTQGIMYSNSYATSYMYFRTRNAANTGSYYDASYRMTHYGSGRGPISEYWKSSKLGSVLDKKLLLFWS